MGEQRIKVFNQGESWLGTECYIGEHKIDNVKSVDFRVGVDVMPTFIFETYGLPNIDMSGDIYFKFSSDTVQQAAVVMLNEFRYNSESMRALIASIASVLKELPKETDMYDVAERIAHRIVGIENEEGGKSCE